MKYDPVLVDKLALPSQENTRTVKDMGISADRLDLNGQSILKMAVSGLSATSQQLSLLEGCLLVNPAACVGRRWNSHSANTLLCKSRVTAVLIRQFEASINLTPYAEAIFKILSTMRRLCLRKDEVELFPLKKL